MTELTQTLIERIKNYLVIQDEIDAFTLYNLIFEWLRRNHPSQFDGSAKETAQERYTILSDYLAELKREIDFKQLSMKPAEIVTYEKNIEIVKTKNEIITLREEIESLIKRHKEEIDNINKKTKEEIESLNNRVSSRNYEIENLNKEIDTLKTDRYKESVDELKQLYKPTKSGIITISVSGILLLLMTITSQFNTFNNYLVSVSPIDPKIINWALFIVLILTIINQLYRLWKKEKLRKICDKLISQELISEFNRNNVKEEDLTYTKNRFFTEKDVEDFIKYKFCRNRFLKSLAFYIENIALIKDDKSINYMKNVFIDNLLTKKYISYGNTKNMTKYFIIK